MDDEISIVIRIKKTETGYSSTHEVAGLGLLAAGIILIDVGRDILLNLASHHHAPAAIATNNEEIPQGQREATNGH